MDEMHLNRIFLAACVLLLVADLLLLKHIESEIRSRVPHYYGWKHSVASMLEFHRKMFSSSLKSVLSIILGFLAVIAAIVARYLE
jgi:hypothetical protein